MFQTPFLMILIVFLFLTILNFDGNFFFVGGGVEVAQTELQDGSRLPFSYIFFSSFTFPDAPYRIFLLFLPWIPCYFYLVVIEQQLKWENPIMLFYFISNRETSDDFRFDSYITCNVC